LLAGLSFSVDPFLCPEKVWKISSYQDGRATWGFQKGAGRPKGSRNRATIAREAWQREALAAARAENANLSASDYLLHNDARDVNQDGRRQYRNFELCDYLYRLTSANCDGVIW
jgi:hypothetical protein